MMPFSFLEEEGSGLNGRFLALGCLMSFDEALKLLPLEAKLSGFELSLLRGFMLSSFSESFLVTF